MSEPLVTQRELEGLLRRLRALEARAGRTEVRESPKYETGTYTPTYEGGTTPGVTTYSAQTGRYTRTGDFVTVWGTVIWTAASGTGNAQISLPFSATATTAGALRVQNLTFANGSVQAQVASGTSFILIHSPATNAAGTNVAVEAAGTVIFEISYPIA